MLIVLKIFIAAQKNVNYLSGVPSVLARAMNQLCDA